MPAYVSMMENPRLSSGVKMGENEGKEVNKNGERSEEVKSEDEIEDIDEDKKISSEVVDLRTKNAVNEINVDLADKVNKEKGSFSNYIPHHLFGKESVHT